MTEQQYDWILGDFIEGNSHVKTEPYFRKG